MDSDAKNIWENFVNPPVIKNRLISASIYVTAYEILKNSIIERVKSVYVLPITDQDGVTEYESEVLSKDKKKRPLSASLNWLYDNDVFDDNDLKAFKLVTDCRNIIAHEMPLVVTGEVEPNYLSLLIEVVRIIRKIEIWWIINFEIPANSDYDGKVINEEEIIPGILIMIQMMLEVALGPEEQSTSYLNALKQTSKK
ncbi:hypothetical protein GCM10027341_23050 [Spirosoma knui]